MIDGERLLVFWGDEVGGWDGRGWVLGMCLEKLEVIEKVNGVGIIVEWGKGLWGLDEDVEVVWMEVKEFVKGERWLRVIRGEFVRVW